MPHGEKEAWNPPEAMCLGKQKFATRGAARLVVRERKRRQRGPRHGKTSTQTLEPYRCLFCTAWHLGNV